jgi:hypothetical protein
MGYELNATTLYTLDSTFKYFIDLWDQERECPVPLVDVLLEAGLDKQAEVARWCSEQESRPVFSPIGEEKGGRCGVYPTASSREDWYFAPFQDGYFVLKAAHRLPGNGENISDTTPTKTILKLLDTWSPP